MHFCTASSDCCDAYYGSGQYVLQCENNEQKAKLRREQSENCGR